MDALSARYGLEIENVDEVWALDHEIFQRYVYSARDFFFCFF